MSMVLIDRDGKIKNSALSAIPESLQDGNKLSIREARRTDKNFEHEIRIRGNAGGNAIIIPLRQNAYDVDVQILANSPGEAKELMELVDVELGVKIIDDERRIREVLSILHDAVGQHEKAAAIKQEHAVYKEITDIIDSLNATVERLANEASFGNRKEKIARIWEKVMGFSTLIGRMQSALPEPYEPSLSQEVLAGLLVGLPRVDADKKVRDAYQSVADLIDGRMMGQWMDATSEEAGQAILRQRSTTLEAVRDFLKEKLGEDGEPQPGDRGCDDDFALVDGREVQDQGTFPRAQMGSGFAPYHTPTPRPDQTYFRAGTLGETEDGKIGFQPNDQGATRAFQGLDEEGIQCGARIPVDIDESDVRNTELDEFMGKDISAIGLPHYVEHSLHSGLGSTIRDLYSESESTVRAVIHVESTETDRAIEKIRKFFKDNQIIGYDPWPKH
jgi:hypothetical protein